MDKMPEYRKGDCRFCYDLAAQKYVRKRFKKDWPKGFYEAYKVSLVCSTYRKGVGQCGSLTLRSRPLNFCPECGRPIKKRKAPAE